MKQKKMDAKKFRLNKETLANLNASVMKTELGGKEYPLYLRRTTGCGESYPEKCTTFIPVCTAECSLECTGKGPC